MSQVLPATGNTEHTRPENRAFYPALDGLRAIAFLMVFFNHYGPMAWNFPIFSWGWMGVDVFFVLSGFLITGILFDTLQRHNFFQTFYIRRSLRIFPLFYGFWMVLLLLTPLLHIKWNRYNFAFLMYFGNFFIPKAIFHPHAYAGIISMDASLFHKHLRVLNVGHLWSLCIEEQFYIFWPAIVWLVRSRTALLRFCLCLIVITPMGRALYQHMHPETVATGALYCYTWARVDTLLFGAALALWMRGPIPSLAAIRRFAWVVFPVTSIAFCIGAVVFGSKVYPAFNPFVDIFGFSLIAFASSAVLLLAIDPSTAIYRFLRLRPLRFLGRISYGLYFFHAMPLVFFRTWAFRLGHSLAFLSPLCAFLCSLAVAWLSFHFYESWFLNLKERWTVR